MSKDKLFPFSAFVRAIEIILEIFSKKLILKVKKNQKALHKSFTLRKAVLE